MVVESTVRKETYVFDVVTFPDLTRGISIAERVFLNPMSIPQDAGSFNSRSQRHDLIFKSLVGRAQASRAEDREFKSWPNQTNNLSN